MRRFIVFIVITLFVLSSVQVANAASAGDEGTPPPPPSGGGGGGGGPQFYDYFVPLVFNDSNPHGYSEVVVWLPQPSVVITSFAQNELGSTVTQAQTPQKLTFNPVDNPGLTNGSLIRLTTPALVSGQRATEDITDDESFAYSILPKRMMGFEYYAPFDGIISVFSQTPGAVVRVANPDGTNNEGEISIFGHTSVVVQKGAYVNSSEPSIAAFYTDQEGMSASMAVPRYLHGNIYSFDSDIRTPNPDEIDRSYISINPSEPTDLNLIYANGSSFSIDIFDRVELGMDNQLRSIVASRGKLEVNIRNKYDYGGLTRSSTVQLMAAPEMRAGEVFMTPYGFSSHLISLTSDNTYNVSRFDPNNGSYVYTTRNNESLVNLETLTFDSVYDTQFIVGTNYMFGMLVSPGKTSHPMAPSMAIVNIPLNPSTSRNVTGLKSTWYRFANLAVKSVQVIPGPVEEYTGQTVKVEFWSNGSLPSSGFKVEVSIDGEVYVDEEYDFLQVNETLSFEIKLFLNFGKKALNITAQIDTDNRVSEIVEDDNKVEQNYNVQKNIRLRWSIYGILAIVVLYALNRLRKWLRQKREVNRAHVDAILQFEEEEE